MGSNKHVDFVAALAFMALGIFIVTQSYGYYQAIQVRGDIGFYRSPGFFPTLAGAPLFFLSFLLLIRSLKGGAFKQNLLTLKTSAITLIKSPTIHKAIVGCIWMGLYVFFLMPQLGFIISSILFLVAFIVFLQYERLRDASGKSRALLLLKYVIISCAAVYPTYAVFRMIFRVPLP